ncbi:MAG: tetratricopeptide repeat protein, partial [Methylomonas sp.]
MVALVILIIVVVIVGALFGGESFGGTIRTGCGTLLFLLLLSIFIVFFVLTYSGNSKNLEFNKPQALENMPVQPVGDYLLFNTQASYDYIDQYSAIDKMIAAVINGDESKFMEEKSKIESSGKSIRGDRKAARILNDKALVDLKSGNYDSAVSWLYQAFQTDQGDTEIASNLGYALIKSGRIRESEKPFRDSIILNPNRETAWANL